MVTLFVDKRNECTKKLRHTTLLFVKYSLVNWRFFVSCKDLLRLTGFPETSEEINKFCLS